MTNDRLINIFLELVRIDGMCGHERDIANYVLNFLKKLGLSPYEDNAHKYSGGNTGNIICHIGTGGDRILLSHMDTARSTRNVNPIINNGTIRSDGTTVLGVDNRAGVAVLLYAIEHTLTNNIPHRDFTLGFTICEETTMDGARYLQINNNIKMGFVFDSAFSPGHFIHGTCGAASFTITVHGRAAHSGLDPDKGINSIMLAAEALSQIKNGQINEHTIINIGTIQGGSTINVVPDRTVIRGEIRTMRVETVANELGQIKEKFDMVAVNRGGNVEVDYTWDFKPFHIHENERVYKEAVSVINRLKLTPTPVISWSGGDANYLNEKKVPSINFGIGARNPHSNDEYITINDLYTSAGIALELITKN